MSKLVYNYNPDTFFYTGEDYAQESPREPGEYLLPAYSTTVKPPPNKDGYVLQFIEKENTWKYIELIDDRVDIEIMWRNNQLKNTDKYMISDYPISMFKRFLLKKYRKKLRNWPNHNKFPDYNYRPKSPL